MFKVVKTRKMAAKNGWKRMITKPTFFGPDFTRRLVKYERFIRPMGLRYKKVGETAQRHGLQGMTIARQMSHIQNLALLCNFPLSVSRKTRKIPCSPS
jgi:hypothetical protein